LEEGGATTLKRRPEKKWAPKGERKRVMDHLAKRGPWRGHKIEGKRKETGKVGELR
jgi:hypothetical protein